MALRTTATQAKRPGAAMPSLEMAKFANPVIKAVLRSPLHGFLSKDLMLITFKGRKSGRLITTPVSYMHDQGTITLFTRGKWWKSLRGGAPVTLRVRGRDLHGKAEAFPRTGDVVEGVSAYIRARGLKNVWKIRMSIDRSRPPTTTELIAAAQGLVMVRVRPAAARP